MFVCSYPIPAASMNTSMGSLTTTAEELARFMMAYLDEQDGRLLRPETKEEMFTMQNAHVKRDLGFSQGLAWMISDLGFLNAG